MNVDDDLARHSALRGALDKLGELREHATGVARWKWRPAVTAGCELSFIDQYVDALVRDIDPNQITIPDKSNWTCVHRFWRDVANTQTGCAA